MVEYDVAVDGAAVSVAMTLTSASCPAGDVILDGVRAAVSQVARVSSVDVRLVWEVDALYAWTLDEFEDYLASERYSLPTTQRVAAIRLLLQCRAVLSARLFGPLELHQHIAELLARRG